MQAPYRIGVVVVKRRVLGKSGTHKARAMTRQSPSGGWICAKSPPRKVSKVKQSRPVP